MTRETNIQEEIIIYGRVVWCRYWKGLIIFFVCFWFACGEQRQTITTTPEDILEKYADHLAVDSMLNKLELKNDYREDYYSREIAICITKQVDLYIKVNRDYLNDRFVVLNEKDSTEYPCELGFSSGRFTFKPLREVNPAKYLLVGFNGISEKESDKYATPPLFFLYEGRMEEGRMHYKWIDTIPRMAGELFKNDTTKFVPFVPAEKVHYYEKAWYVDGTGFIHDFDVIQQGKLRTITRCSFKFAIRMTNNNNIDGYVEIHPDFRAADIEAAADGSFHIERDEFKVNGKFNTYLSNGKYYNEGIRGEIVIDDTFHVYGEANAVNKKSFPFDLYRYDHNKMSSK